MLEFKTKKGKRIDGVKIDDQDIYLDFSSGNLLDLSKEVKTIDSNDTSSMFEIAKKLFSKESYELVKKLEIDDFVSILNLVIEELNKKEQGIKNNPKFRKE